MTYKDCLLMGILPTVLSNLIFKMAWLPLEAIIGTIESIEALLLYILIPLLIYPLLFIITFDHDIFRGKAGMLCYFKLIGITFVSLILMSVPEIFMEDQLSILGISIIITFFIASPWMVKVSKVYIDNK